MFREKGRGRKGGKSMPAPGSSSSKSEKKRDASAKQQHRRDPYEVLGVGRNAIDQQIKSAQRKLTLKTTFDGMLQRNMYIGRYDPAYLIF